MGAFILELGRSMSQPCQVVCRDCSLSALCLPVSLEGKDLEAFDSIVKRNRLLRKGEHLILEGDAFKSVFIVRSGALKAYMATSEGEEQVTGFFLPSEMLGVSGVDRGVYPISALALETTMICEIPYERLELLSEELPDLRRQVLKAVGRRLREDQYMKFLLSKKNADERVATFIINLATKFGRRGFSLQAFRLVMSRGEMGNYLGLAVETVSRVFSRFQKIGLINANGKEIEITNLIELCNMSGNADTVEAQELLFKS